MPRYKVTFSSEVEVEVEADNEEDVEHAAINELADGHPPGFGEYGIDSTGYTVFSGGVPQCRGHGRHGRFRRASSAILRSVPSKSARTLQGLRDVEQESHSTEHERAGKQLADRS